MTTRAMSLHQQEVDDVSDNGSFVGFDEDDDEHDIPMGLGEEEEEEDDDDSEVEINTRRRRRRRNKVDTAVLSEPDSDEEDLERFVLGGKTSWREQLFRDDFTDNTTALTEIPGEDGEKGTGHEDLDDSALFFIDTAAGNSKGLFPTTETKQEKQAEEDGSAPAWEDSDDERLTVSLANSSRLRNLRNAEDEDVVSGTEYARRLRRQYLRLYPLPTWAREADDKASKRRRRRSSAAATTSGSEMDTEEEEDIDDPEALPLETFLRDASNFNGAGSRKRRKLRPETIDIQRTRDIPDTHKAAVSSLSFHPTHNILLSSSTASILYLHQINPTAHPTPNPALTSVQVQATDIRRSEFVGSDGDEIMFAGRRRYLHSWNLSSGLVKKVSQIQGHQKEQRTMENFRTSPCGRYLAMVSSDKKGGGMLNIVSTNTMQWIAQARVDGRGGISDFVWWSDGNGLSILGKDGQVTEWSMHTRRTVGTWRDEGSIGGTVIAMGGSDGPEELGGDRWVAVGSNSGILNVYDRNELIDLGSKEKGVAIKKLPTPRRMFEQLTTAISVITFSPDGQLLGFGSLHKKDALRLVHLPSCTVYRNWPTEQTPLGRITAVAFNRESEVLAVGNDQG
ncbi:WD40-repeat-containing domain protein, partial [Diplogelasinospora grovesii]